MEENQAKAIDDVDDAETPLMELIDRAFGNMYNYALEIN